MAIAILGSNSVRERWIDLARIRRQLAPTDTFYEPKAATASRKQVIKRKRR